MFRLALPVALALSSPAFANPIAFNGDWSEQGFSLFSGNDYGFRGASLTVASDDSVSLTWRRVEPALWSSTSARWAWSVTRGVPATDLTRKGGDDRDLALYFVFLPEAEARALQGANIRRLLSNDAVRVLVYVRGGAHARGSVLSSPYLGARGKTVVLRGTGTGAHSETVDLSRDYARAFGGAPGALVGLAVSADSDDTNSSIRATLSDLRLN